MSEDVLAEVCRLHVDAFADTASGRLGPRYARKFMTWFLNRADTIALVAELDAYGVVGYVIGAPMGYNAALTKSLAVTGLLSIVTRPRLLLSSRVRATLAARASSMVGKSPFDGTGLPAPVMSLVGIAVAPNARGKGAGIALMTAFEERARALKMAAIRLSVYPDNSSARRLYERCGWHALPAPPSASGAIYYGRIVPMT